MTKKIRVAVIYGGRSGEHEVSLISAASVIRNLDRNRFDVIPIAIDKSGKWLLNDLKLIDQAIKEPKIRNLPILKDAMPVVLTTESGLIPIGGGSNTGVDVVFPVMHGTYCEDGAIQGLLELANLPYVGCGVLGSAVGMDKDVAKRLARDAGIPIVPYLLAKAGVAFDVIRAEKELGYPMFIKPANAGSSVGVHKARDRASLNTAIADALTFDTKVLVEAAIDAREIEIAALENPVLGGEPLVSIAGEITPTHEFYSYEAKYLDENGAKLDIPAKLDSAKIKEAQALAQKVFIALECEGMARVDLFMDKKSGLFYLNEINTIPGFTHISMYPKLWEASGISYQNLLTRLIELALARHGRRSKLVREFDQG